MDAVPARVKAFDWLRGLAVVLMVETHALAVLRPELRAGAGAARLDFLNGLIAPAFIFASGFSIALVQVRGAHKARWPRIRRTLRRLTEVLAVGLLINAIWFPIRSQPQWLARLDILSCIALSLYLVFPLIAALAKRPDALAVTMFLLALGLFLVAPFGEPVQGPWANLLNRNGSLRPVFPLLPWAGYVFLGAALGAVAAKWPLRVVEGAIVLLGAIGLALWRLSPALGRWYPPHGYGISDPGNHGHRWLLVCGALIVLLELERLWGPALQRWVPLRWINLLGTTSLAGYFFHEELLFFQVRGRSLGTAFQDQLDWGEYGVLVLGVLVLTTGLVWATDRLYPWWERALAALMAPTRADVSQAR